MRVLLCPLGSPGFAFPAIAVARRLREQGHDVRFVTSSWLEPLLAREGLGFAPGPGADGFETSGWHQPPAVRAQVRRVERAAEAFDPDVIVTSALALGPLLVGERNTLPVAVLGLLTRLFPTAGGGRRDELQGAWDACRGELGMGPASVERLHGDLYFTRSVPELGGLAQGVRVLVGACSWEPATPRVVTTWLDAARASGRRVVYVQQARGFGAPGFWPLLGQALPHDVVIAASTSRHDSPADDVRPGALLGPVLPHGAILDRAIAVICSGTTSVVVDALARGVPIVVVPGGGEQHDVAALLVRAGVAVCVDAKRVDAASLSGALQQALALDPAPREVIRRAFLRLDGPAVAAAGVVALR